MGIMCCSEKVKRVNPLMFIKCYKIFFIVLRTYNECNKKRKGKLWSWVGIEVATDFMLQLPQFFSRFELL